MTSRPTRLTSRSSTRGREYCSARARSVAAEYKLPVTLVRAALAEHIDTTRAWLTDSMIATIGARVTITWVLLQRRDRSIPSFADVYRQAGLFDLHPHPTPPADLAGNVPLNKLGVAHRGVAAHHHRGNHRRPDHPHLAVTDRQPRATHPGPHRSYLPHPQQHHPLIRVR